MTSKTRRSELPPCDGTEPPQCCVPIAPAFLSTRALLASLPPGSWPTTCPNCGSQDVTPLFWPDPSLDQLDCADCGALFSWRA